jgi:type II secretory pathway component PulK
VSRHDRDSMVQTAQPPRPRCRRSGSVLVLVLIVVTSLTVLSMGLAFRTRIDLHMTQSFAHRAQAYHLALGGIERMKVLLSQAHSQPTDTGVRCPVTLVAEREGLFDRLQENGPAERDYLACSLYDEQSCLNINLSDPAVWQNLGYPPEYVASVLDWIDADDDPTARGAESDFYERLDTPYVAKNAKMLLLKELLYVRGVDHGFYLGQDVDHNGSIDQVDANYAGISSDGRQEAGAVDVFTVVGNGKVNINTVSLRVLASLPGFDQDAADAVGRARSGPDGSPGTEDDVYFRTAAEYEAIEGLSDVQKELLGQYCRFDSEYFRVFSYAAPRGAPPCCLMATIHLKESTASVLYVERLL